MGVGDKDFSKRCELSLLAIKPGANEHSINHKYYHMERRIYYAQRGFSEKI